MVLLSRPVVLAWLLWLVVPCAPASVSTNTPVPPLQWINLTPLLSGSDAPPPLRDASVGYDDSTRSLLIFGGESSGGFPQSQTYLLDLNSLTWSQPSPPANSANLQSTPPARSAAVSGDDFAASNRNAHVIIGGKGSNGEALSDIWAFDYVNHFWAEVSTPSNGPSARWGASGGIDTRTAPVQDQTVPGPNNTILLSGGFNPNALPVSDAWKLELAGTLSSNLPTSVLASWTAVSFNELPLKVNQGSTVLGQDLIVAGGCNVSSSSDSCAQQDSYVLNFANDNSIAPGACPAPRVDPAMVPNTNGFSSSFANQVFMVLGTFNTSLWNDGGNLDKGEIAVLDASEGSWARILPSGDPGSSGQQTFPSARAGAAARSFTQQLVGGSRSSASDTILFGGLDANGNYLSEVWLLRAYNGVLSSSNQKWTGFGDGTLQTGTNASGTGVTVQYITSCASAIANPTPTSASASSHTSSSASTSPSGSSTSPVVSSSPSFDTSASHKIFAPLSIALIFASTLLYRTTTASDLHTSSPFVHLISLPLDVALALVAYGLGLAGLATSFTSESVATPLSKRATSSAPMLKTSHGRAGLALFICLYGLVPLLYLVWFLTARVRVQPPSVEKTVALEEDNNREPSTDLYEKNTPSRTALAPNTITSPTSARSRHASFGQSIASAALSHEGSDEESVVSSPPARSFEVVNRPTRRSSGVRGLSIPLTARNLSDISWLDRRRSLQTVGELDYALTRRQRQRPQPTRAQDAASTRALMTPMPRLVPIMPSLWLGIIHILFHLLLLGLSILCLVALRSIHSIVGLVVLVVWILAFYVIIVALALRGQPRVSVLSAVLYRLRGGTEAPVVVSPPEAPSPAPASTLNELQHSPPVAGPRGPYTHHQPPFRSTVSPPGHDDTDLHEEPRSVESDEDDEEDEDARQHRMEAEIGRRDVSIITVPKRKLWVTNPSTDRAQGS